MEKINKNSEISQVAPEQKNNKKSNTYFRKKVLPINPQMFPAAYFAVLDATKDGLKCMMSKKNFDYCKILHDAASAEDKTKFNTLNQISMAYYNELCKHMEKGNRDHWLFTYEDPDGKVFLDLVLSKNFINKCVTNNLDNALTTALLAMAAFTYEMCPCDNPGDIQFTKLELDGAGTKYKN